MDAVFEFVAHNESESWTSLPHSFPKEGLLYSFQVIAERLSARQLIVQCGLKSKLVYIYIYIYIYVRNFRHA